MRTILTALSLSLATAGAAQAEWPEKPIKVVVPFNPGGTSDQVSRAFTTAIQENDILPQPLNVINVGGGHFSIGARQVLDAEPDGYTFLTLHIALMGAEAGGMLDFSYRDFVPVATTGEFCLVPMVRKDSGIDSVEQLLARAAAEPDTLVFGVNLGAINHLAGVMLQNLEDGASFRFAQVGGGTANYTSLTGAQTDVAVLSAAEVANFTMGPDGQPLEDAQIKPLGYTGTERVGPLPDLPTLQELGYDMSFCVESWWFAPQGTPQEAIDGMADALGAAMGTERVQTFMEEKMFAPVFLEGDEMQASLDETWERTEPIAQQAAQN